MRKNCETCKHDDKDYPCYPFKKPCDECVYTGDVPNKWEAAEHYEPDTNADSIRAMSDKELAEFLADRFANESCQRLSEGNMVTATQMEAIRQTWYCCWMDWLKQPAEVTADV